MIITSVRNRCFSVTTLEAGGNVLLPVHGCGVLFDLIELVSGLIKESAPLTSLLFVSPTADASLAFANISAEWFVLFDFYYCYYYYYDYY